MAARIIVASGNKHKLREISHILRMDVAGHESRVKENGKTFEANAIKKAKAVAKRFPDDIVISDDSGLMVDALGGKPGVMSARYASPPTAENLCSKLLGERRLRSEKRSAKFVCVIAVVFPGGKVMTVKGVIRGKIAGEMRGNQGFGYDPVFIPRGYKKTFAEMKSSMKNRLSHRGKALKKLKDLL